MYKFVEKTTAPNHYFLQSLLKISLTLFFGRHPSVVEHEAQLLLGLGPPEDAGTVLVALRRLPRAQAPRRVVLWARVALPRPEVLSKEALGTQLAKTILFRAIHSWRTSHTKSVGSHFPTLKTSPAVDGLGDGAAVRDEPADVPVDPVLVADVGRGAGGELLVELVVLLADGRALLAYEGVSTQHFAVFDGGRVVAALGDGVRQGRGRGTRGGRGRRRGSQVGGAGVVSHVVLAVVDVVVGLVLSMVVVVVLPGPPNGDGEAALGLVAVGVRRGVQHVVTALGKGLAGQEGGRDMLDLNVVVEYRFSPRDSHRLLAVGKILGE